MHKYRMWMGIAKGLDLSSRASSGGNPQGTVQYLIGSTSGRGKSTSMAAMAAAAAAAEKHTLVHRRLQEYHTLQNPMTAVNTTRARASYDFGVRSHAHPPARRGIVTQSPPSPTTTTTPFPKWPFAMVESKGNYKEDADMLEPVIGGPLYSAQSSLPRLPVPELQETISTFLPTALPLAESEQEIRDLMDKCRVFPQQARKLHEKLLHRKQHDMKDTSWLQLWWNTAGYLQVRDPVTVNVSYYFNFKDDPTTSPLLLLGHDHHHDHKVVPATSSHHHHHSSSSSSSLGVKRGAALLYACAEFRKMICSGAFPHERIGRKEQPNKTPLCSVAFKYMFHCCRIPKRGMDTYKMYDPSLHTHCIVARNGQFFAVEFVDDHGNPLNLDVLEERLHRCIEMANGNHHHDKDIIMDEGDSDSDQLTSMLGWLTSSDRDSWADAREELLRMGGKPMEKALETLESGALLLCLDNERPMSKKECGDLFWTGNLTCGHNRWFDKSIQLFVTDNGKAGLQGEHSMMDGMPVIAFADYITKQTYSEIREKSGSVRVVADDDSVVGEGVTDIFAQCKTQLLSSSNFALKSMIVKAKEDFRTLITNHEQHVESFQGYGSTLMKKMGYSPDAYAQMAIQLAVYRLHGKQVGTYEATQMRPYLHGRTETTRTVSLESAKFVQRMGMVANFHDSPSSLQEKKDLLQNAVKSHVNYVTKAAKGKGVDRHFLGMSMLAEGDNQLPELYSDPVFIRSKTWRVSTSHLTHPNIEHWGFGEVVADGLGIAYSIKPNSCIFNIAARKEHGWTEKLSHLLEEALLEMKAVNDPIQTSKL